MEIWETFFREKSARRFQLHRHLKAIKTAIVLVLVIDVLVAAYVALT